MSTREALPAFLAGFVCIFIPLVTALVVIVFSRGARP